MTNINDCKHYTKPFYYPDEAAAEWCGMSRHEYAKFKKENSIRDDGVEIFEEPSGYGNYAVPPNKPCFIERLEQICFAIEAGDIPHQRDGRGIVDSEHVARYRRTVKPQDLKAWIEKTFPNEKPSFLFDQLERKELLDAKKLLEENEKLKLEVEEKNVRLEKARDIYRQQRKEFDSLKTNAHKPRPLPPYLDPNSPWFCKELEVMLQAAEDIHVKGWRPDIGFNNHEELVQAWLDTHFQNENISTAFYERLHPAINPKPRLRKTIKPKNEQ